MKMTSAIKGQLTRARLALGNVKLLTRIRLVFERYMPREQAKHAARKYLSV